MAAEISLRGKGYVYIKYIKSSRIHNESKQKTDSGNKLQKRRHKQVNKPRGNWLQKCTKTKAQMGITNQNSVAVEMLGEDKVFP